MNDLSAEPGTGYGGFKQLLDDKALEIQRHATRRHIEMNGFVSEPWYSVPNADYSYCKILTLDHFLNGPVMSGEEPNGTTGKTYYAPYKGEVWNHVFEQLSWVRPRITQFGQSHPAALKSLIDSVKSVPSILMGDESWRADSGLAALQHFTDADPLAQRFGDAALPVDLLLDTGMLELSGWSGATADAYTDTFGGVGERWRDIAYNNYALGEYVVRALEAQLAVFLTVRETVVNICDRTNEALFSVNESESSGPKVSTLFTIAGAIVGVGLSIASFGVSAAVVGAAFAIGGALIAEAESGSGAISTGAPEPSEINITGATPMELLTSMSSYLGDAETTATEKEREISEQLRTAYNVVVDSADSRSRFEITFAKGTPMDDMGERSTSMVTSQLVDVATTIFPNSANRVLQAHELLAGSEEGDAFAGEWYGTDTLVGPSWRNLRDLLQDLTAANGGKIQYAGEFLLDYAVQTGAVDEGNSDRIKKTVYDELDVETSGTEHRPSDPPEPTLPEKPAHI